MSDRVCPARDQLPARHVTHTAKGATRTAQRITWTSSGKPGWDASTAAAKSGYHSVSAATLSRWKVAEATVFSQANSSRAARAAVFVMVILQVSMGAGAVLM